MKNTKERMVEADIASITSAYQYRCSSFVTGLM